MQRQIIFKGCQPTVHGIERAGRHCQRLAQDTLPAAFTSARAQLTVPLHPSDVLICCDAQKRREEREQQRQWQRDRVQYGKTDAGNYVDQRNLEQLMTLGYDMPVAAEALRQVRGCQFAAAFFSQPGQRDMTSNTAREIGHGWRFHARSAATSIAREVYGFAPA